jgi:hypothetical protein
MALSSSVSGQSWWVWWTLGRSMSDLAEADWIVVSGSHPASLDLGLGGRWQR